MKKICKNSNLLRFSRSGQGTALIGDVLQGDAKGLSILLGHSGEFRGGVIGDMTLPLTFFLAIFSCRLLVVDE